MYMADQNAQPLSEWAANACPISHSDHCRIFLSDRLLAHTIPLGRQVHGVLGMNFLRQFETCLNFKQATIQLY